MSSNEISDFLQLPSGSKPSHYVEFDTLQLHDIKTPNTRWNTTNMPEPITSSFSEWGSGGATQAITESNILIKNINKV